MTPPENAAVLSCPVHATCAHPCRFVRALSDYPRELVDAAVAAVANTYDDRGVGIWWRAWITHSVVQREQRLRWAATYRGMVAT